MERPHELMSLPKYCKTVGDVNCVSLHGYYNLLFIILLQIYLLIVENGQMFEKVMKKNVLA